jgi:hypothetical protein
MIRFAFKLLGSLALLVMSAPSLSVAQTVAPKMFQQTACPLTNGICAQLCPGVRCTVPPEAPPLSIVRAYSFTLPARGDVQINFDGSMQCVNRSTLNDQSRGVVDLSAQIVGTSTTTAVYTGPSGQRINMRLPPAAGGFREDVSTNINLHTSRSVTYSTAGVKNVYYKFTANRLDQDVNCFILSGAFSLVYLPH